MSLSRFIGESLQKDMRQARDYERAMRRFFEEAPVGLKRPGRRYPKRAQLYHRGRLR
jgi:hypothetical protein